eukprot:2755750-Rhodomonas_salina.1
MTPSSRGVASPLLSFPFPCAGHEVFCVRYSPDGQFIAAARGSIRAAKHPPPRAPHNARY